MAPKRVKQFRAYVSWQQMIYRCYLPTRLAFKDYGGRGIKVCDRWLKFENFLADMGERPEGDWSIDRMDTNGNYEPGNCRWATRLQQNQNRRGNHAVEFNGKTQTLRQWARELGINYKTLHSRAARIGADAAVRMPYSPGHHRNESGRFTSG